MYHTVDPAPSVLAVSPAQFQWQMEWLYNAGYRCPPLGEIVERLACGLDFPERSVVLTFDDGYQSLYQEVMPILQRYGFSATVFLVAGFCGKDNRWPGQPASIPTMKLLSWEQIDEMAHYGIEFGSHSLHHPRLDQLPASELQDEIVGSKAGLERQLGRPVMVFAYPYGHYSETVKEVVQQVYAGACSTRVGLAMPDSDRYALERVEIKYLTQPWIFRRLFHAAFPSYLSARRAGRAIRSALIPGSWK
jgi:peptidoglycan/xylan/chitin deacetylase (PgdA/CDA1 family)